MLRPQARRDHRVSILTRAPFCLRLLRTSVFPPVIFVSSDTLLLREFRNSELQRARIPCVRSRPFRLSGAHCCWRRPPRRSRRTSISTGIRTRTRRTWRPTAPTSFPRKCGDDRTVTFRLKAPDARTVALTGGPILLAIGKGNTPIPFEKGADGVWTLTVGPLKPNMYIYRLVVDGVAVVDPNNTLTGFSDQPGYSTRRRPRRRARRTTTPSAFRTAPSRVTSITPTC